jgi:3-deoxy-D-manno-octulosonate 8-phosphate phosphatase (KDO 8-P phosphatase)
MLLLDVDGVMTDGKLIYFGHRDEAKAFHARDGLGVRLFLETGYQVGVVTGRGGEPLNRRCRELGIEIIYEHVKDKKLVLDKIRTRHAITPEQIAFMGDDLIDLPLLTRVGLPIAVADAHPAVRQVALWITENPGGSGAVREVCEGLLSAQGHWDDILGRYT